MARGLPLGDLESHRSALLRFAKAQLRNDTQAEDCVQETLSAAIQGAGRFAGDSAVRTWLIGILKHKILDQFRRTAREQLVSGDETSLDDFDALFEANGHYVSRPFEWTDPEEALTQREFFDVLEACMARLPPNTATVFRMREVFGMDIPDICKEMNITANNCWVMLYRARMSLRECLEQRWFSGEHRRR